MADDLVETRERELKFDVSPDWVLPTVYSAGDDARGLEPVTLRLITTYYDTASRDLLAVGVTLRRRTGDADQGWH
ncbi:MAG: CYTH domain-containing protein, partial [Actinomycetota bacterium]|nr:CYTH domain-containing protein [Actinomycetota bacterium]